MKKQALVIVGNEGLSREFVAFFAADKKLEIVGFCGLEENKITDYYGRFLGTSVSPKESGTQDAVIAVANPILKRKLFLEFKALGYNFPTFIHNTSVISQTSTISEGCIIAPNCIVGPEVVIEQHVVLNFGCGLGHDVVVGEFTSINPGVQIGGHTKLGKNCLVGSGTTIVHKQTTGNNCKVASGSAVFSKIPDNSTFIGNPARKCF